MTCVPLFGDCELISYVNLENGERKVIEVAGEDALVALSRTTERGRFPA